MGLNKDQIGENWIFILKNCYFLDGKEREVLINGFNLKKK
jgi:hypothetical protein